MSKYMTEAEMQVRLEEGEPALDISIDKWKRAIPPMGIEKEVGRFRWWFFEHCMSQTCALCEKYLTASNPFKVSHCHKSCPLRQREGSPCHDEWVNAKAAASAQDREMFMVYRRRLIKVMEDAQKKATKEGKK